MRIIGARAARNGKCTKCNAVVLIGWSDDAGAFMVRVDPIPLSPLGEFLALADGRRTYAVHKVGHAFRLNTRDRWQIAGRPAGTTTSPTSDVYADHACGRVLPRAARTTSTFTRPAPQGADDGHPPF